MTMLKKTSNSPSEPTPYWTDADIPPRFDIALLRPVALPKGQRFETAKDAEDRSRILEQAVRHWSGHSFLAETLADCREGYYECKLPICPLCARRYRRWFIAEALRKGLKGRSHAKTATIYLAEFAEGQLDDADLPNLHAALRARLRRAGFTGSLVIGGTEVRYSARDRSWLVHVHVLLVDVPEGAINSLAKPRGAGKGAERGVLIAELYNPIDQISYLQKFGTYHRPGQQRSTRRPQAYPLPSVALLELLTWMAKYDFDDFRFIFGARRRGDSIVCEPRRGRRDLTEVAP